MQYIVVGLGNPGEEYENTRHNVGRMVLSCVAESSDVSDWRDDNKLRAKIAHGVTAQGVEITLVLPDNYMNRSGGAVAPLAKTKQEQEHLVVVHDDIDLPLGEVKVTYNRGTGGHNGVESIVQAIKSKSFTRVRVGVIPTTPTGKLKKPNSGKKVHDFILKRLSKKDRQAIETVVQRAAEAVLSVVNDGRESAMQTFNGSA